MPDRTDLRCMVRNPTSRVGDGRARRRWSRPGVTLIELAISLTLAAGLAVAIGQVVHQLTRGAAAIDRRSQAQTEAAVAMLRLRSDLEYADWITQTATRKISFRHPDLTGDGAADTVTYEWSGVSGDPLTRVVNGSAPETVLEQCRAFTVSSVPPTIRLIAGTRYDIRMEMFENNGNAVARLYWSGPDGSGKTIVPTTRLFPAYTLPGGTPPTPTAGTGLIGEYYDNADFTNLKMTRLDASIDFDWGNGAPVAGMGSNTFSVRWTGHLRPQFTNDFTFYAVTDDGVRLWIDNKLIIDNWTVRSSLGENSGSSTGIRTIWLRLEAGPAGKPVVLDGSVSLINAPPFGV
jgi:hypothetical protein